MLRICDLVFERCSPWINDCYGKMASLPSPTQVFISLNFAGFSASYKKRELAGIQNIVFSIVRSRKMIDKCHQTLRNSLQRRDPPPCLGRWTRSVQRDFHVLHFIRLFNPPLEPKLAAIDPDNDNRLEIDVIVYVRAVHLRERSVGGGSSSSKWI